MSEEKQEIQSYSLEEMFNMAQAKKKPSTNGRGIGIWLLLWGLICFAFEAYCGLSGGIMWAFRVLGLFCLLMGALSLGMSFEKVKKE